MTDAAKWKKFVEWWDEIQQEYITRDALIARINRKIKELRKGDTTKQ